MTTTISSLSVINLVNSLVNSEEFNVFFNCIEKGGIFTGNALGQILEYLITGRDTLSLINDFDMFTWLSESEIAWYRYEDYRGETQYSSLPESLQVHMALPEYTGKVSICKIFSWAGRNAQDYFTNNPMGNWVDCWMTKDEVYLGASFERFIQERVLILNKNNTFIKEAFPKFEKKLSQGYTCDKFLFKLQRYTADKELQYYKEIINPVTGFIVKYYTNLSPEAVMVISKSPYLEGESFLYNRVPRWYLLLDLIQHYVGLGEDSDTIVEWCRCLERINIINFVKVDYTRIAYFYYMYAKAVTIQPVDKKWRAGLYPYQQLFKLFVAQGYNKLKYAGKILPDEWKSGKVDKGTMMYLGVKGSPKISKVLLALGLSEKMVSIALGAGKVATSSKTKATTVRSDEQSFLEQGNSVYYSSCQATDPRASWSGGTGYNKVSGDLPHIGDTLFMWTIGSLMTQDGKGFVCRAKLRVIFKPTTNQVLGLYLDRVYGNKDLLMEYIHELEEWWTTHSINKYGVMTPIFTESYSSPNPTKFWSPSSVSGYQDSLKSTNTSFIEEVSDQKKSLLYQAYCSRQKVEGCYTSPLAEVRYNPQNGKFS